MRRNQLINGICLGLTLVGLTACGSKENVYNVDDAAKEAAAETQEASNEGEASDSTEEDLELETIEVSSVEEFLDALGSDREIVLTTGTYDLSSELNNIAEAANDAAFNDGIKMQDVFDGYELQLSNISNLTIRGEDEGIVRLLCEPRYAEVLQFDNCSNIKLSNMTMGHTIEQGSCEGDVLEFNNCEDITLTALDLYGCGTYGIAGTDTDSIHASGCVIRECSYGIMDITGGKDISFTNCEFKDNDGYIMLSCYGNEIDFDHCGFDGNCANWGFIDTEATDVSLHFTSCSFGYEETYSMRDVDNGEYGIAEFTDCTFAQVDYAENESYIDEYGFIHVYNVEQLLTNICPYTHVLLEPGYYDLSTYVDNIDVDEWNEAHSYVKLENTYDGVEVIIYNVNNLYLSANDDVEMAYAEIISDSPHADVLRLENCTDVYMTNIIMGHSESGDCSGDVIELEDCININLTGMELYGCGVCGINSVRSYGIRCLNSYIYDCSMCSVCIDTPGGPHEFISCNLYSSEGGVWIFDNDGQDISFNSCYFGEAESKSIEELAADNEITLTNCSLTR